MEAHRPEGPGRLIDFPAIAGDAHGQRMAGHADGLTDERNTHDC